MSLNTISMVVYRIERTINDRRFHKVKSQKGTIFNEMIM